MTAADEVITRMEATRAMTPVAKTDAWVLVAEIRYLREVLADTQQHAMEASSMARDFERESYSNWQAAQDAGGR
jgi:cell division protein ZapA (FtsZ GTPase activity inhibitor)